jgi:hypothetical protein
MKTQVKQAFLYKNPAPNHIEQLKPKQQRTKKDKEKVKILFFFFLKFPTYSQGANRNETETNRRESVASVGDEHASLPYRTVTDCDALYEP